MAKKGSLKQGVVCVLDALGTKGVWNRKNPSSVVKTWDDLVDSFMYFKRAMIKDEWAKFTSTPNVKAFSDTIMITYHGKNLQHLLGAMSVHVMFPFCQSLMDGIFLRGVITIGEYYESKSTLIGPAIDEAVNWYTKTNWFGVSTTPSASFFLDNKWGDNEDKEDFLIKYDVPLKDGNSINTWVLNWPAYLGDIYGKKNETSRSLLIDSFSKSTIFDDSYSKYENTKQFAEFLLK